MRLSIAVIVLFVAAGIDAQVPLRSLDGPLADVDPQVFGDFDGDGDVDVLAGTTILVNDGTGSFVAAAAPSLGAAVPHAAGSAVDVDGDGLDDLVLIDGWTGIRVVMNQGGFVFADLPGLPAVPPGIHTVTSGDAGDVDGDGTPDLIFATGVVSGHFLAAGPTFLWLNVGGTAFVAAPPAQYPGPAAPPGRTFLRDLDQDGDLDALFVGARSGPLVEPVLVVDNAGGGTFVVAPGPAGAVVGAVAQAEVGDFDGDGRPDLVGVGTLIGTAPQFLVFLNSPVGLLPPVASPYPNFEQASPIHGAAAIDADGDGFDEIFVRGARYGVVGGVVGPARQQTGTDYLLPVTPPASFVSGSYRFSGAPSGADLDGDGDRDLLVRSGAETVRLMNTGTAGLVALHGAVGGFAASSYAVDPPIAPEALDRATGDFDGDGDLDLLLVDPGTSAFRTSLNGGEGRFSTGPTTSFAAPGLAGAVGAVGFVALDADGDGDDDLYGARGIVASYGPAGNDLLVPNLGGGVFGTPIPLPTTEPAVERIPVDWDGDGDLDLLIGRRSAPILTNGVAPPLLYVRNLGAGAFASPVAVGAAHATFALLVADFDADGDPDVLQVNGSYAAPSPPVVEQSVLYRNVSGAFVAVDQPAMTGIWAAAGDLNGDGAADAVVDGQTWFATTGGIFVPASGAAASVQNRIALRDVDDDLDLDLVETPCTVLPNLGGGVFGAPESVVAREAGSPWAWTNPASTVADLDRDGDLDVLTPDPRVVVNVTRQLDHRDVVRLGGTTILDVYGTPGGGWFLYAAPATGFVPTPYGPVLIDPASALFVASGTHPAAPSPSAGTTALSFAVPAVPALAGLSLHWQGADLVANRLTNRLTSTVLAY